MDGYAKTALWAMGAAALVLGTILAVSIDWQASKPQKKNDGTSLVAKCTSICESVGWSDQGFANYAKTYEGSLYDECEMPCSELRPTRIRPLQPAAKNSESCCTYCSIGKACGDSCIAAGDSCYISGGCACDK